MDNIRVITPGEMEYENYAGFFSQYSRFNMLNENPLLELKNRGLFSALTSQETEKLFLYDKVPVFFIRYRKNGREARILSLFPSHEFLMEKGVLRDGEAVRILRERIINEIFLKKNPFSPIEFRMELSYTGSNEKFMNTLGFKMEKHHLVMEKDIKNFSPSHEKVTFVDFSPVKTEEDIKIRTELQNSIFCNKNRIPIDADDVKNEMKSRSYINSLSLIFRKDGIPAGYGQIIEAGGQYILINFGLIPEYRGMGLSGIFLDHLIEESAKWGIDSLKLEVMKDNERAYALYTGTGFRVMSDVVRMVRYL